VEDAVKSIKMDNLLLTIDGYFINYEIAVIVAGPFIL